MLLHRADARSGGLYDGYGVEVTGYPAGWSVAAARAAITADAILLRPLLDDADPAVRIDAANALATACDHDGAVRAAFRVRFDIEQDPTVRAALLLAVAEATRAHPPPPTTAWLEEQWQEATQVPEARLAAAIGWLCLTDDPAPDGLRAAVDDLATDARVRSMDTLPWMAAVGGSEERGLRRCIREMLHPGQAEPVGQDDTWAPWTPASR